MKKVFVSIINYNGNESTLECLENLKKVFVEGYYLTTLVIDNGSKEKLEVEEKDYKGLNLKLIKSKKNLGFSGGHNLGFSYAVSNEADYVVVLNNDVLLDEGFIVKLFDYMEKNERVGVASPKIYFAPGFEYHKGKYKKNELGRVFWYAGGIMDWANVIGKHRGVDELDGGQYDSSGKTDLATGCCMIIRRDVFEKVGYFDDSYFLYYEDNDLCQKVKRSGYEVHYASDAVIWHKNAGSAGGSGSPLQDYFITRNRMIFGLRYAPIRAKFAILRESLKILARGRKWQKRGILDFYLRKLGRGTYPIPN